jgi:hypothetical protein
METNVSYVLRLGLYLVNTFMVINILYYYHLLFNINNLSQPIIVRSEQLRKKQHVINYLLFYKLVITTPYVILNLINSVVLDTIVSFPMGWILSFAIPELIRVNQSELQIWSLQISSLERISARNCVLIFLEHHQSTQHR